MNNCWVEVFTQHIFRFYKAAAVFFPNGMKKQWSFVAASAVFAAGVMCGLALRPAPRSLLPASSAVSENGTALVDLGTQESSPATKVAVLRAHGAQSLQPRDFASRFDRTMSIGNRLKRARAIAAIADDLDLAEVSAALNQMARFRDLGSIGDHEQLVENLFSRWGELDPETAFQRALTFPMERVVSIKAVIRGWASKDPAAAEAWVAEFHSPLQDPARRGLITAIADTDPKRAFALLGGLTGWGDPSLAEAVFGRWTEGDPMEAAEHAAQLRPGHFRDSALKLVAEEWANKDGESAMLWAEGLPDSDKPSPDRRTFPYSASAATIALKVWMERDPGAAVQWIEQIADEKKRNQHIGSLVALTADEDPHAAQRLTAMLPPGREHDSALKELTTRWVRSDVQAALAWIETQSDAHVREVMVREFAFAVALTGKLEAENVATALRLAQSLTGTAQDMATTNVLNAWARLDPKAAAGWAGQHPEKFEYLFGVTKQWARKEPKAAETWVNSLPAGSERDRLLGVAAHADSGVPPEAAKQWIGRISDPQQQQSAYKSLAERWLKVDVKAARKWISSAPLSQEVKNQLLKTNGR